MFSDRDFEFELVNTGPTLPLSERIKMMRSIAAPDVSRADIKKQANDAHEEERNMRWLRSPMFQVLQRELLPYEHGFGEIVPTYLSVKRIDREPFHDWRAMQRIKNSVLGPEWEGVEIYPAESRLVDTSNQYHLFCWQRTFPIFIFNSRKVLTPADAQQFAEMTGLTIKQA